jgi:NADH:ubiquinone oxidoreductase subunit 4 (subunit M)
VQRLFYDPQSEMIASRPADDLRFRELAILWPIAVLTLVMGLVPSIWLPSIEQAMHSRLYRLRATDTHFVAQGGQR